MRVEVVEALLGRRIPELYDDSAGAMLATHADEIVEAAFVGMPMGWAWSLHFCNEAISHAMRVSLSRAGLPPILLGDRQQAPFLHRQCPVMAPYVDNLNVLALDDSTGQKLFAILEEELSMKGFVVRDRVAGESRCEFLGMILEGEAGVLRHKPKRNWRLWMAITALLGRRRACGDAMRFVLGHVCHQFGLAPHLLAAVQCLFSFAREALGRAQELGERERAELQAVRGLLFSSRVHLWKRVGHTMFCSDASSMGYALHESPASSKEVLNATRWMERWRSPISWSARPTTCPARSPGAPSRQQLQPRTAWRQCPKIVGDQCHGSGRRLGGQSWWSSPAPSPLSRGPSCSPGGGCSSLLEPGATPSGYICRRRGQH